MAAALLFFGAGAPAFAQDAAACGALRSFALPGTTLEITSAEHVPAGPGPAGTPGRPGFAGTLPAHCRVDGVIERRTGVGGEEYGIRFALALPDNWAGQFLFQGGGGLNGNVAPPLGGQVAGATPALARGFAVVTNDTGHQGAVFDGSFFADQEAALNFLWLANGKVTVVAKALIDAYYREPAEHSYFVGCSTGGREAMIMSQRYPTYFDGLVSGAPAMRTGFSNLGMRSVSVALSAAAQRDANGSGRSRQRALGSRQEAHRRLAAQDLRRRRRPRRRLDLRSARLRLRSGDLVCSGAKNDSCLSPTQASAVKQALSGPKTASGRQVYPGYLYDTGITFAGPGHPRRAQWRPEPGWSARAADDAGRRCRGRTGARRPVDARRYGRLDELEHFLRSWR